MLKILVFSDDMVRTLEIVQNKYMRSILGVSATANPALLRIVLGIPPLSHFLAKICLSYYHDCFLGKQNVWKRVVRANYEEYLAKWWKNNCEMSGVPDQFLNPTRQYMIALKLLYLDRRYADPAKLPPTRGQWNGVLVRAIKKRAYKADLDYFTSVNG